MNKIVLIFNILILFSTTTMAAGYVNEGKIPIFKCTVDNNGKSLIFQKSIPNFFESKAKLGDDVWAAVVAESGFPFRGFLVEPTGFGLFLKSQTRAYGVVADLTYEVRFYRSERGGVSFSLSIAHIGNNLGLLIADSDGFIEGGVVEEGNDVSVVVRGQCVREVSEEIYKYF